MTPEGSYHPQPTVDIVIRSYYRDLSWARYCLASIERYCRGFRDVVLIVPRGSFEKLRWMGLEADRVEVCPDYPDDYLGQQVTKLYADEISDADFLCHVDSDCVFREPVTPGDLIDRGRPLVLMRAYDELDPHVPWKQVTQRFLGFEVAHEFMRRPPYTFPRWIYQRLREHAAAQHGTSLRTYVLNQPPRGFSEFNALGAFAYERRRDEFSWVDEAAPAVRFEPCRVFWSRAGVTRETRAEIDALLGGA